MEAVNDVHVFQPGLAVVGVAAAENQLQISPSGS
ncbi:DUF6207 family protein [Streptomyces lancefieldiae]